MNAEQFKEAEQRLERARELHKHIRKLESALNPGEIEVLGSGKEVLQCPSKIELYDISFSIGRNGRDVEAFEAIAPVLRRWLEEAKAELEAL